MNNPAPVAPTRKSVVAVAVEDKDCDSIREGVKRASEPLECLTAKSLDEAIETIGKRRSMALVCDWNFAPLETLTEFLQKLRLQANGTNVAIIMMSPEPLDSQIVAICSEYYIRNVIFPSSVVDSLGGIISDILLECNKPSALRSFVTRIEHAHAKGQIGELDIAALDFYTLFPHEEKSKVEYANYCIRRGDWKKAKEVISPVVQKNPKNLRAINTLVRILLRERNFSQAQKLLAEAEMMSPANSGRMVLLGDIYREKGMTVEAETKYKQALSIHPNNREAKQGVAKLNISVGELNSALQLLRETSTQEEIASFFNDAAIFAVQQKKLNDALRLYQASLSALDKKNLRSRVLYNVGLAYHKGHRETDAISYFQKAADEDPSFSRALDTLATLGYPVTGGSAIAALAASTPQSLAPASVPPTAAAQVKPHSPNGEFGEPVVMAGENLPVGMLATGPGIRQVSTEKKVEPWGSWEVMHPGETNPDAIEGMISPKPEKSSPQTAPAPKDMSDGKAQEKSKPKATGFIDDTEEDV